MHPRRLEVSLALNLTALVCVALLLSNAISLILSQKENQRVLVSHAEKSVAHWKMVVGEALRGGRPIFISDLKLLEKFIGPPCIEVSFGDVSGVVQREAIIDKWGVDPLLLESVKKKDKIVTIINPYNFYLFFAERPLVLVLPVFEQEMILGAVSVVLSFQPFSPDIMRNQSLLLLYSFFNLLILVAVGFFRFSAVFIRPLDKLVEKCVKYDVSDGLPLIEADNQGGGYGKLSRSISGMLSRVKEDRKVLKSTIAALEEANQKIVSTQKELLKTEKIAAVGRLSAGLAHEIGNPLGIIQGYLELLKNSDLDGVERLDFCKRSIEELDRINYLIEQLLGSTRIESTSKSVFSVQEVLANVVEMVAMSTHEGICKITKQLECTNDEVRGSRESLHQVFLNCLLNAIDSIKEKGETPGWVSVVLENVHDKNVGSMIRITFEDNGLGIKAIDRETIFEPFFTTKKAGHGTGLGLTVSELAVNAFQGRFLIAGEYGHGAIVQIELPAAEKLD